MNVIMQMGHDYDYGNGDMIMKSLSGLSSLNASFTHRRKTLRERKVKIHRLSRFGRLSRAIFSFFLQLREALVFG